MTNPLDLVTLTEAKAFLRITANDEDVLLAQFITGITRVVEGEVGPVVQGVRTADIDGACATSVLAPVWPIASLTSGAYSDGDTVDVSVMAARKGLIVTTDGSVVPTQDWALTFVAGRVADTASVPQNIKQGALEVLKLAWATQRGSDAPAFLISYRAAAWFKPDQQVLGFA